MPVYIPDDLLWFPPVDDADADGLLAVGGNLSTERLLLAYRNGIFPWFNDDDPPLWWSPDPRFVLFPDQLVISRSMRKVLAGNEFKFMVNTAFEAVIENCSSISRKGMDGTWITNEVAVAYTRMHHLGYAHCAEAWKDGELVGGLYGIKMGNVFFGESMFSKKSNASKYAFINWVTLLKAQGVKVIDCQVYTAHLESLGACMIPRTIFMELLDRHAG